MRIALLATKALGEAVLDKLVGDGHGVPQNSVRLTSTISIQAKVNAPAD
jgi:hypothetical protein